MKQNVVRTVASTMIAALALSTAVQAQTTRSMRYVPTDTVVRLTLAESVNSRTARAGDLFTAQLSERDRSGFPERTRFEGSILDVRRADKGRPGELTMKVHRAFLPNGGVIAVNGTLAGLSEDDVSRTTNGRLVSRGTKSNKFGTKWIGYGAAGGAVLATVLGDSGDLLKGALLGALGGAAYEYLNKDKKRGSYSDVELSKGTEFGVRVHGQVAFRDSDEFRYASYSRSDRDRDLDRDERYDSRVDRERDYDRDRDERDYDRNYDRTRDERDRDYDRST
ncbi:MAG: copper amine oxidase domain protein, partial [Armatimonadetes bacterium]|nr:copper amine oxidase domain protein [Armatimonadota bacterium]